MRALAPTYEDQIDLMMNAYRGASAAYAPPHFKQKSEMPQEMDMFPRGDMRNPSTAAASYMAPRATAGMISRGPMHEAGHSFDLDFMMPPDVASIDSDINKIGALTPTPLESYNVGNYQQAFPTSFDPNYMPELLGSMKSKQDPFGSHGGNMYF